MILKRLLKVFGRLERPIGWGMLLGSVVAFALVWYDVIKTGDFKFGTLLIALDLFGTGFGLAQEAEENVNSEASKVK